MNEVNIEHYQLFIISAYTINRQVIKLTPGICSLNLNYILN